MTISDFNAPFYAVYVFMFLGLAWSTVSVFHAPDQPHLQRLWLLAAGCMGLTCLGLMLLPHLGPPVLGVTTMATMAASVMLSLILRAWRTPLRRHDFVVVGLVLLMVLVVFNYLLTYASFQVRVAFLAFPGLAVQCWGIYEGLRLGQARPSAQNRFLVGTQVVLLIVLLIWFANGVFMADPVRMAETGESFAVAVGRLIVVSLLLVFMVAMVGVGFERYQSLRAQLLQEKLSAEALNRTMVSTLHEHNQVIKVLTFSSKASNAQALISNLAHEVNQSLGSIRLYVDHLQHSPQLAAHEKDEVLRQIVVGTEQAQQSLRDFRQFFSGERPTSPVLALDVLTRDILDSFAGELAVEGIEVVLDASPGLWVAADGAQLEVVVLNLLNNALDALRDHDGPRQIGLFLRQDNARVMFSIRDSGPGVPPEWKDKLFTSKFSTKGAGAGLGLWLCRIIIEYHGGAVSATMDGPGARFDFNLPRADEAHVVKEEIKK